MPDHLWGQLLLQIVLIAVNAFFAATEIAVLSLNESVLKKRAEEGDKKAARMLRLTDRPERFLSTIQIGITLAGFLASAFAADTFADRLCDRLYGSGFTALPEGVVKPVSVVLVTLILSYFTLVFGELVPKRIAMKKTEQVASAAAGVIRVVSVVMRPLVWLLSVSTNGVLRLCGINPHEEDEKVTEEEIRLMVDIGEESGTIETEERDMIENVFEFNNTDAADVMIHRTEISALSLDETDDAILAAIRETGLSRFPVYEEDIDNIVGILSARLYLLDRQSGAHTPIKDLMLAPYFVPKTVHADVLFRNMQQKKVHLAIVVDEYGGTAGLVTLEDLLEEIVGNIYDEFDPQTVQEIEPAGENLWKVSGSCELETLYETLGLESEFSALEEEDFDTLSGLVFSQLADIPSDGARVEMDIGRLHVVADRIADRHVESALVSVLPAEEDETEESAEE